MFSNDDSLSEKIKEAGDEVGEICWPMPILPELEKQMTSSKIADVRNQGKGRWGGAIQAAGFLKQFVQERENEKGEKYPFLGLIDIAGTAGNLGWRFERNSWVRRYRCTSTDFTSINN